MRKHTTSGLLLAVLVFFGLPALACSSHGSAAAEMINDWLQTNGNDDFTATGGETGEFNGLEGGVNFGRDSYWVTITGPNGFTTTLTGTTAGDHMTVSIDNDGTILGQVWDGGELEYFLRDAAIEIIENYSAPDVRGDDFVG